MVLERGTAHTSADIENVVKIFITWVFVSAQSSKSELEMECRSIVSIYPLYLWIFFFIFIESGYSLTDDWLRFWRRECDFFLGTWRDWKLFGATNEEIFSPRAERRTIFLNGTRNEAKIDIRTRLSSQRAIEFLYQFSLGSGKQLRRCLHFASSHNWKSCEGPRCGREFLSYCRFEHCGPRQRGGKERSRLEARAFHRKSLFRLRFMNERVIALHTQKSIRIYNFQGFFFGSAEKRSPLFHESEIRRSKNV